LIVQAFSVQSAQGQSIKRGRGDKAIIVLAGSSNADFFVYPNPFLQNSDVNNITFANVKENDVVHILSARGRRVRTLQKYDGDGDLLWDVRNSSGDLVASGVYIYRLVGRGSDRIGKLAVVR